MIAASNLEEEVRLQYAKINAPNKLLPAEL